MAKEFRGSTPGSNVVKFITSGKPGGCFLCEKLVEKLEAHHLSYSPEITAKLCHLCHHTIHFWPNRLSDAHKLKLLRLRFSENKAWALLEQTRNKPQELAALIAPSRSRFVRAQQVSEIKRIKPKKIRAKYAPIRTKKIKKVKKK